MNVGRSSPRIAQAALAMAILFSAGCSRAPSFDPSDGGSVGGGGGHGGNCAADACVAAPPAGWQGPMAFYTGPGDADAPACEGFALDLGGGALTAPAATCAPCACGAPAGQACGDGVFTAHAGASCTSTTTDITESASVGCQLLNSMTGNDWFTSSPVPASGGACAPSGGVATLPKATFEGRVRLCGAASNAGCATGSACFAPSPAYQSKPCVYRMDDVACDAPGFSIKYTAHDGIADARACTACACGAPAGGTCPAVTELYDLPDCVTLINTAHHDGACTDAGGTESFLFTIIGQAAGASCAASTPAPAGQATPGPTFTVCCAP